MEPDGFVQMNITARPDLLNRWLRINFLIQPEKIDALGKDSKWMVTLMCCYTKEPLQLRIADGGEVRLTYWFYNFILVDYCSQSDRCGWRDLTIYCQVCRDKTNDIKGTVSSLSRRIGRAYIYSKT